MILKTTNAIQYEIQERLLDLGSLQREVRIEGYSGVKLAWKLKAIEKIKKDIEFLRDENFVIGGEYV